VSEPRIPRAARTGLALALPALLFLTCSDAATESAAAAGESAPARAPGASAGGAASEGERAPGPVRTIEPLAEYQRQCSPLEELTLECEFLRGLLVAETVASLERLERSLDRRGVPFALAALELTDEPTILVAACRALAGFREEPGLAARIAPLLDSPYFEVQRIAAQLVSRLPDEPLAAVGRQWLDHHSELQVATPYEELDFPAAYASLGFPDVPEFERYTPADSDRSIGWWSPDPAAEVARRLGEATGRPVLGYVAWADQANARQQASMQQGAPDPKLVAENQRLMEQYMQSPSEAILKRVEAIQAEMLAPMERAQAAELRAVERVLVPPAQIPYDQVFAIGLEERDGRLLRAILVYRQPGLERTVIQMGWDLTDHPPAWPKPGEDDAGSGATGG
jgi:hypothetical protein